MTFPAPNTHVSNSKLVRPDWTSGPVRDPQKLWLDKNENRDPEYLKIVKRVFRDTIQTSTHSYPDFAPLYHKLAEHTGLEANNLVLTGGSDGAIRAVFEAFVSPGDGVLIFSPTFAMYQVYSLMYGARIIELDYTASADGPILTIERIEEAIAAEKPKLVCIPNPNSPTGTIFQKDEMRSLLQQTGEAGAVALVDEAYHPFYQESCIDWVREFENLIVTRSMSKAWGLAGLKIGYAAACPALAAVLHKVRAMYEISTVAGDVLFRMLDQEDEMLKSVRRLEDGKEYFVSSLNAAGFSTLPTYGNFQHVLFGGLGPKIHEELSELVYYRQNFREPCLEGYSRFTVTTREQFKPVVDKITEIAGRSNPDVLTASKS
jgi:histidinol-phosphate aminotransferase